MKLFDTLVRRSKTIQSFIFLSLSYYLGVGVSSIVGKLAGKRFLDMSPQKSTWVARRADSSWEHMY